MLDTNTLNTITRKCLKPSITTLATNLSNEWKDETACELHELLTAYIAVATLPTVEPAEEEATITPEPVVRIPIPPNTVCFPVIEEKRTKKRNTPDKYQDRKVVNGRYQRLFDLLTSDGNLGKEVQVKPEDIDTNCSMEELHMLCKKFNSCTWRMKNASGTKLMYRRQLMNIACRFVRADQDLRALRFARA